MLMSACLLGLSIRRLMSNRVSSLIRQSPDVEICIAIPESGEAYSHTIFPRTLQAGVKEAFFSVVVRNVSKRPLEFFTEGNSWCAGSLSFELVSGDGTRWDARTQVMGYSRNFPAFVRVMPGDVWVREVYYAQKFWQGFEAERFTQDTTVTLTAKLAQSSNIKGEPDLWNGAVKSKPISVTMRKHFP